MTPGQLDLLGQEPVDQPHAYLSRERLDTSLEAGRRAISKSAANRKLILAALRKAWRTDEELQSYLNMAPNTERPRRKELLDLGLIADSGTRRPTVAGNPSVVWRCS